MMTRQFLVTWDLSFYVKILVRWFSGGDGKKVVHVATPHPAKKAGKTPGNGEKSKQQSPKSAGSVTCKSCSRYTFTLFQHYCTVVGFCAFSASLLLDSYFAFLAVVVFSFLKNI